MKFGVSKKILAVGALALVLAGCSGGADTAAVAEQQQEIARLTQENQELNRLREENQEVQRLRKENQDLVKLRSQYQEVIRLRKENEQLRNQLARTQQRFPQPPSN